MSYESESILELGASAKDVYALLGLLRYQRISRPDHKFEGELARFNFFDDHDYRSYTGVLLSVSRADSGALCVYTRTPAARSHYDLLHQNKTIKLLRKQFRGTFVTDAGRGRYFHAEGDPPAPAQSGCHLAFQRFGGNLIKADVYLMNRQFPSEPWDHVGVFEFIDQMNPKLLSNNLLLPYLVATLEEYFKSTFVALLKYSPRKESFLKNVRVTAAHLVRISSGNQTVESAVAELLPFQRISAICGHFKALDSKLDIAGALRRPYRGRKQSLYDSINQLVDARHRFIHRAEMEIEFTNARVKRTVNDLEAAVERCYKRVTSRYSWAFEKGWGRGRRP